MIMNKKERIIMKKYRISALQRVIMSTFVEAENEQEAIDIAKKYSYLNWEMDGSLDEDYFDYEVDHSFDPERVKS
jgi:hypothetical protein